MSASQDFTIRVQDRMSDIAPAAWDACANPDPEPTIPSSPMPFSLRWRRAAASAAAPAGVPQHFTDRGRRRRISGAMPLYLKSHSRGEYVFDHGWADAYERAGGTLLSQAAVLRAVHAGARPPAAGQSRGRARRHRAALLGAARSWSRLHMASSLHVTFLTEDEWTARRRRGASCSAPISSSTG